MPNNHSGGGKLGKEWSNMVLGQNVLAGKEDNGRSDLFGRVGTGHNYMAG